MKKKFLVYVIFALALCFLSLNGCDRSPAAKAARFIKKGDELLAHGDFEKARIEYRDAGAALPNSPDAFYHIGLVDEAEGSYRIAFVSFRKALEQDGHFKPALLKLAEYFIASGQYDEGAERIDAVLAETPADPVALALRAKQLYKQKHFDEAAELALQALKDDRDNVNARAVLASIYDEQGDLKKALTVTEEGLLRQPKDVTLLRLHVGLLEKGDDLEATARAYQALFTVMPDKASYRTLLAEDYVNKGKIEKAEAVLRAGVESAPKNWDMKHALIVFLDTHHSIGAPESEIKGYIKAFPKDPEPISWLTALYIEHGQFDRARQLLEGVISERNYDAPWVVAMDEKAELVYKDGDKQKAQELVSAVLEKAPNDVHAALIRAHLEADEGYYDQTVIDLRALISAHPDLADPYNLLSQVFLRQGHTDLAIETLNQLREKSPENLELRVQLAELYVQNGDAKHASDILFLVTKADPTYVAGWESLARVSLELKNWETADTAIANLEKIPGQQITASLLRAEKFELTGQSAEALVLFKRVIDANPASPQAEIALTFFFQIEQGAKRFQEASDYLRTIKASTPLVYSLLGQCYLAMGYDKAAAAAFDNAIEAKARFPEPYMGRAVIYVAQKENAKALTLYQQAAAVSGSDTRAAFAEALLEEDIGNNQAAFELYEDMLKKDPQNQLASNNLAELICNHFFEDAKAMARARQLVGPFTASTNPLLLDTLAWVDFREGKLPEALSVLDRAKGFAGASAMPPEFHYHRGMTLLAMDKKADGIVELRLAMVGHDPYPGRAIAKTTLYGLTLLPH